MEPNNVYLAFFDILGFKALRFEKETKGLYKLYMSVINPMISHSAAGKGKTIKINGKSLFVPDFSEMSVKYKIISDSIIFYTKDDSFTSFLSIINSSFQLLQFGFAGLKTPLRGAISHGDLIDDPKGTYIGSAVEDAYINEGRQVWSGCILTDSCSKFVQSSNILTNYQESLLITAEDYSGVQKDNIIKASKRIVEYDCPMQENPKDGPLKYFSEKKFVLNWTLNMFENASEKSFPKSDDKHANLIRENTVIFEKWARNI